MSKLSHSRRTRQSKWLMEVKTRPARMLRDMQPSTSSERWTPSITRMSSCIRLSRSWTMWGLPSMIWHNMSTWKREKTQVSIWKTCQSRLRCSTWWSLHWGRPLQIRWLSHLPDMVTKWWTTSSRRDFSSPWANPLRSSTRESTCSEYRKPMTIGTKSGEARSSWPRTSSHQERSHTTQIFSRCSRIPV